MPNPNPQPAPESEPFVYGRDFQFSDLDLEYLEAVHQLQALSIAFGRVGDEAYQAAIAKGMQADGHPAATLWGSLRLFNGLLLHAASPHRTEESLKTLLAAMDIAVESYSSDEFLQHLDRIRQTLWSRPTKARKAALTYSVPSAIVHLTSLPTENGGAR